MPIPIPMAIAIYFTMWWTVLFAVLPFGIRSQEQNGVIAPGSDRGAPVSPRIALKALWTTVISAGLFAALMLFIAWH